MELEPMRRSAWIYVLAVLGCAGALSAVGFSAHPQTPAPWGLFLGLVVISTLLRVGVVDDPRHRVYEGSTIGFMAGVLVLPFWLFALQVGIAHCVEWAWVRLRTPSTMHLRAWYIQPFNIAKCIISGSSTYALMIIMPVDPTASFPPLALVRVLLLVGVYVLVNQLLLGMALSLARGISFRQAGIVRDGLLMEMPLACIGYLGVELLQRGPLLAMLVLAPIVLIYQAFMLPKLQDEAMQALEEVNNELTAANRAIRQLNDELFMTLAKIFDARDPYVAGHAAQVAIYAVTIATELGLPPERIEVVRQCAFLHDIGKIAIPEAILHKPGRLTDAEYTFLKKHADIGADFIATSQGLRHLAPFIRHHHERWDGRGYPAGLAGEAIPLEARILNVCDSVEAMASDRPYHRGMSAAEIISEVERCAGTQFDPIVAEMFIRIAEREGPNFVVNSARTVAEQYANSEPIVAGLTLTQFAEVYGSVAV
jgi:putative nucleotidyltransferase with HDIG domain